MGVGGQHHAPAALPSGKRPITYCKRCWVGPWAGLDRCGNHAPTRIQSLDCAACNELLYGLHYPGPKRMVYYNETTNFYANIVSGVWIKIIKHSVLDNLCFQNTPQMKSYICYWHSISQVCRL